MITSKEKHFAGGLLIIAAGVAYLLAVLNVIPQEWARVIISWPMLLIVASICSIIFRHYIGGAFLFICGGVLLLPSLSTAIGFTYNTNITAEILWPLAIIFIGIMMFTHPFRRRHNNCCSHQWHSKRSLKNAPKDESMIDYNFVMNGTDEIFLNPVFAGGEINTVMGGVQLDLRRSSLPEGESYLKISSVCGGVNLIVPNDWNVELRNKSILGGMEDKRNVENVQTDRKLIIEGSFVMGGGAVSNEKH